MPEKPHMEHPAVRAAETLAWEMQSFRSIEIRTHDRLINSGASPDPGAFEAADFFVRYIETNAGERRFERHTVPTGAPQERWIYYCNGKDCADEKEPTAEGETRQFVYIKRDFGIERQMRCHWCPEPLSYYYVGPRPLHQALRTASFLGERRHLDRDCDAFLIVDASLGSTPVAVYVLDRSTSTPVQVKYYADDVARTAERPRTAWTAKSLQNIEGHLFPMTSELILHGTSSGPSAAVLSTTTQVEELHFNRDYPKAMFWPKIDSNATLIDAVHKKAAGPKDPRTSVNVESRTQSAAQPIRAEPAASWSDRLPAASLTLGLAILIAGGILWWRSRWKW